MNASTNYFRTTLRTLTRCTTLALALAATAVLAGTGCSSSSKSDNGSAKTEEKRNLDPKEGMTKAQITDMYGGEPESTSKSSDGTEVWVYIPNYGERFIPFNYGYRPKYHRIYFNNEGVVVRYEITE